MSSHPPESDKNKSFRHTGASQRAVIELYFLHQICLITLSYTKLTQKSQNCSWKMMTFQTGM